MSNSSGDGVSTTSVDANRDDRTESFSAVSSGHVKETEVSGDGFASQATMDRLLPVVNRLHNIFQRCGVANPIDLPQIVVVGSQSSGKSSVLEAIVGFDFLPRGSGVVTRSPILIQLHKLKNDTKVTADARPRHNRWVEFLHAPNKTFVDNEDIRREIAAETERVAGKNKQLSPTAIIMKVFSADVVDLTLIDLPGLTKVPVGDQPPDIEKLVRALIHSYIEKPNTIILAVHPANTDLATSDALQMARRVDPNGLRTLGVITKLDLMDAGTNALDMLQGRVIPLRRGYIGVVNRSQADLESRLTVKEAHDKERAFFQSHPVYAPHAAKMGSQHLATTLSTMLMEHIRAVLPSVRSRLTSQLSDVRRQLETLGAELSSQDDAAATLLHLLTGYASAFSDAIDGRPRAPVATSELAGGARISFIFHERFGVELSRMDAFEGLGPEEMRTALRNATGHRTPLFIPETAFELLVRRQIHRFLKPSLACVDMVYDELTRLAEAVESSELARFHRLRVAVSEATLRQLRERKGPTIEMVQNLIDMEMSYVNTWHPDFIGGKRAIGALLSTTTSGQPAVVGEGDSLKQNRQTGRAEPPDVWVEKNLLGQQQQPSSQQIQPPQSGVGTATAISRSALGMPDFVGRRRANARSGGIIMPRPDGFGMNGGMMDENGGNVFVRSSAIRGPSAAAGGPNGSGRTWLTEEEQQELEILRKLIESYFDIVRKRVQDMVPKAIITFLVKRSKESLQSTLVSKLYKPNLIDKMMVEGAEAIQQRKDMHMIERMLEDALTEVNEIRDVH